MVFQAKPLAQRIDEAITKEPSGCWTWAYLRADGYGQIEVAGKRLRATRVVWEMLIGPIPADLELDHVCRNKACVNPEHLEPVTHRENLRRTPYIGARANQTHCIHGHLFDEENTHILRDGTRRCRACDRRRHRAKVI